MITTREYPEIIAKVGYENLSPANKNAHDIMSDASDGFTDFDSLDYMMEDESIKKMINMLLEYVEKQVKQAPTHKIPQEPKPMYKAGERVTHVDDFGERKNAKILSIRGWTGEEHRYEVQIDETGTLVIAYDTNLRKTAKTKAVKAPKPSKAPKEPKPKAEKKPKAPKVPKPKKEKAPKPTKAAKKTKPKAKPSTKKKVEKFDAKKYQMVKKLPVELTFVKRYLKMDNKQVTKAEVRSFIKSIERQNAEGAFTIKGKYGKEVQHIQAELHKLYNDKTIPNTFTFALDKSDESALKKYKEIVNGTMVDFGVQFIKRYLTLLGKETVAKAKRFLSDIANAEETGKLKSSNKNIAYIDTIKRVLGKYIDGKTDELEHSKAELQGLQGVLNIEIKHGDAPKKRTTVKKKR